MDGNEKILDSGLPDDFNLVKLEVLDDDTDDDGLPKDFAKMIEKVFLAMGFDPKQNRDI
jgi:hypothetical protein